MATTRRASKTREDQPGPNDATIDSCGINDNNVCIIDGVPDDVYYFTFQCNSPVSPNCSTDAAYQISMSGAPTTAINTIENATVQISQTAMYRIDSGSGTAPGLYSLAFTFTPVNILTPPSSQDSPAPSGVSSITLPMRMMCNTNPLIANCPQLQILDRNSNVISAPATPTATLGYKQITSMQVAPGTGTGSYALSQPNWSFYGSSNVTSAKSYDITSGLPPVSLKAADYANTSLPFYFIGFNDGSDSGNQDLVASATVTNANDEVASLSASAEYSVNEHAVAGLLVTAGNLNERNLPGVGNVSAGPIQVGAYDSTGLIALSLGTMQAPPATEGVQAEYYGSSTGYTSVLQLVNDSDSTTPTATGSATPLPTTDGAFQVDGCVFKMPPADNNPEIAASGLSAGVMSQAPYLKLDTSNVKVAANQSFLDYFLYRPPGSDSIWLSYDVEGWNWQASATRSMSTSSNGGWSLDPSATASTTILSGVPAGYNTYTPTFTTVFRPQANCPQSPAS